MPKNQVCWIFPFSEIKKLCISQHKSYNKKEPQLSSSAEGIKKDSVDSLPKDTPMTNEEIEEIQKSIPIELEDSYTPEEPLDIDPEQKSEFALRIEERRSELLRQKEKLAECLVFLSIISLHFRQYE